MSHSDSDNLHDEQECYKGHEKHLSVPFSRSIFLLQPHFKNCYAQYEGYDRVC